MTLVTENRNKKKNKHEVHSVCCGKDHMFSGSTKVKVQSCSEISLISGFWTKFVEQEFFFLLDQYIFYFLFFILYS